MKYWKNNGSLNIVEYSDGSIKSYLITPALIRDIQSGKRDDVLSLKDQEDLLQIELSSYDPAESDSLRAIMRTLMTKNGVQILFRDHGLLVGFVTSIPADRFYISMMHEGFDLRYDNLYMYSVAGKTDLFKAIGIIKDRAKTMSFNKILSHCLNPRLVKVQERFGFRTKKIIPNFLNRRDAEYMELDVESTTK